MVETADAVVVGGGIMGVSIAYHLALHGAGRVVLLEKGGLAGGASGKSTALLRMHYDNAPEARMTVASAPYFRHWADVVGVGDPGYVAAPFIMATIPQEEDSLRANVAMLQEAGVETWLIDGADVRELDPALSTDDLTVAAYEPSPGYADPAATVYSFARAAQARGAEIREGCAVRGLRVAGDRLAAVLTEEGEIATPAVVLATGSWVNRLTAPLGVTLPIAPQRNQVTAFRAPFGAAAPRVMAIDSRNHLYFRPGLGGLTVSGAGPGEPDADPDTYNQAVDAAYVPYARACLSPRVPSYARAHFRGGWCGVYDMSPDEHALLGAAGGPEGMYVACGFSGTGFKWSPAVGIGLAELVLQGRATTVDLYPFRPSRFAEGQPLRGDHPYSVWWH